MPNWKKVIVSGSNATLNSLFVSTSVTASIFSGSAFTGSLFGTASWANNATTSSFATNAGSASYALNAGNAQSASFAATASSADNFLVRGTLTAQTIVAQVITSSTDFVTGSTRFGTLLSNTHQFTGSVSITGSLAMNGDINVTPDKIISAGGNGSAQAGVSMWGTQNASLGWDGFFGRSLYYSGSNYIYSSTNAASLWGTVAGIRVLGSVASALQFIARPATEQGLNVTASDIGSYTRMTILYDGNIGIGTTSPTATLHVSNSTTPSVFRVDTAGGVGSLFVSASSNVGIGTTTPSAKLDVNGNTVITGSLTVITGSNIELQVLNTGVRIGNIITDVHTVTGSLGVSGSVTATNFTGSLFGTASWANNVVSSSYALNAGNAQTASFAITASFALNGGGGPSGPSSGAAYTHTQAAPSTTWTVDHNLNNSYPVVTVYDFSGFVVVPLNISSSNVNRTTITFSYGATGYATAVAAGVSNIISASFATNAATAQTASFFGGSISSAVSASYASSSTSASFATNAVTAQTASFFSGTVTSASYALNAGNTQTASFATNANSASYALNAGNTISASFATNTNSASYALNAGNAQSASFANNAGSASYALNAGNAQSSSFAATASSADNFTVRGTLTAQTIVVQTITSSTDFITGSTRFGTLASNTHVFTGSVSISGSLTVQGAISGSNITGSLLGTASYANNALSSSYAVNSGNTISASFSTNAGSSSYALNAGNTISASFTTNAGSASYALNAGNSITASFATNANSASYALNAGNAQSASFATNAANAFIQNGNSFGAQALLGTNDAQNLAFETNGTIRMTVDSNGNVGIGTNVPTRSLDIRGAARIETASTTEFDFIGGGGNILRISCGATIPFIGTLTNAPLGFFTGATERARIDANGNFGIGTTAPSARLDVSGSTVITGSLTVITGSNIELQVLNTGVRIGNIITDVHTITGSLGISGSVTATNFTGSLLGTASFATSASWAPGGGGGGTPGGSNTQIQYNNASTFGGVPVLTYDGTTLRATGSFTGSLTGALIGTASFATSASWAPSAGGSTFPFTGTAVITGSLVVTGSFDLNNTRFNSTSSATTAGTTIVSSNATGSFNSAFYNYYISSGSNARAGQIMSVWSGSTINYTEVTTTDIGNTNTASLAVTLATGNVRLSFTAPGVWTVRSIVNLL